MKQDLEDGVVREAQAQARQLAEEAGYALAPRLRHVRLFACVVCISC
jgi:hypothetical protein